MSFGVQGVEWAANLRKGDLSALTAMFGKGKSGDA
jgi:hypothetical protein